MAGRIWNGLLVVLLASVALLSVSPVAAKKAVLTLDHTNFWDIVSKHDFIVVEFYAPGCVHCKDFAPKYEKAAKILSRNDPPVFLAKVDATKKANKELVDEFRIERFPSVKILRNGGKRTQDYEGGRDADGVVKYLKRQLGPASTEIKSAEQAASLIDEKSIYVVGVFNSFSGEEFDNYTAVSEKLRADYDFRHTLDVKFLPRSEAVTKPTLRVLKPFDELFADSKDFNVDALVKFIQETTLPLVTVWDEEPANQDYVTKFFGNSIDKVMLLVNSKDLDSFQLKYKDVASLYKGKGLNFLLGDVESTQHVLQYFGQKEEHAPLLIILKPNGDSYLKANVEPNQIAPWVKDCLDGLLKTFVKSEPIPEINDQPIKVVVRDSLQDLVFNSGKNVLLEFYAPGCTHCKKLERTLKKVATSFKDDPDVVIAKFDATANDVPRDTFVVKGFPTVYFRSASGKLLQYDGNRIKKDIISFIKENRDSPAQSTSDEPKLVKPETVGSEPVKDEL